MPGELLPTVAPMIQKSKSSAAKPDTFLYLIVRDASETNMRMQPDAIQSSDDSVYEQDILRDTTSIKPWLGYIDYKLQHGTLLEQAFV